MPAKRGAIATVPAELLDQVHALRAQGKGPQGIWRELGEQLKAYITHDQLHRYIHTGSRSTNHTPIDASAQLGKIADLLERSGIDPEQIAKVSSIKLSEWQGLTKDADGEAVIHDLAGSSVILHPSWEEGPAWPVVQPAAPTVIRPAKNLTRRVQVADGHKVAVILPDVQFGFRRNAETDLLDPYHDDRALNVALELVRIVRPDLIVLLGDVVDLAEFSRFEQEPEFAGTTQRELDAAHLFLARLRAEVPDAEIRYLEGNHDRRIARAIVQNAKAALRLRPAYTTPETWPVLSIPSLLRLDDLGIKYVGGYPANLTWINERLACVHGEKVRSNGSTAAAVVDDERVSVIFGHVHRIEQKYKTRRTYEGARFSFAATPGCLCRVDGAVPSTKGSSDPFGNAISRPEDWQQGCSVVTFVEGDGPFAYEQVFINEGRALFRGMELGVA